MQEDNCVGWIPMTISALGQLVIDSLTITAIEANVWSTREITIVSQLENPMGDPDPLKLTLHYYDNDRVVLHQLWRDLEIGEAYSARGTFGFWKDPPGLTLYGPELVRLRDSKVLWTAAS